MTDSSRRQTGSNHFAVRLFVAGDAPNSRIAKENLRRLREQFAAHRFDVEVVDVLTDPQAALAHGIYVTPALQVIKPGPKALIFGNLSNNQALQALFPEEAT